MIKQSLIFGTIMVGMTATPAIADSGETIHVRDRAADRSIDCQGKPVDISGQSNDIVLKNCPDVTISGQSNDVLIGAGSKVVVSGDSNDVVVTLSAGGDLELTGDSNDVLVSGKGYTVRNRGRANEVERR